MKIIILDRDGVINFDSPDYIKSINEWHPIPGSIEAVRLLTQAGFSVYIVTNQAGIGRGIYSLTDLGAIHQKMLKVIESAGGKISAIYFCPHHPDDNCPCRKPGIGLLIQIAEHSDNSLIDQPFVGDSLKDIQAAKEMGCQPILVKTGNGAKTLQQLKGPIDVYDDLLSYTRSII